MISCNVAGRDVTGVVQDLQKLVDPLLATAPGYRVEYGGQFESAAEANRLLLWVGCGVILAIALLLYLVFGSARDAAIVLINMPLALIGGVLGVWLSGGVLNVASMIGFITVFGIACATASCSSPISITFRRRRVKRTSEPPCRVGRSSGLPPLS